MCIQAVKGVEIGLGFEAARRPAREVHDEIVFDDAAATFRRRTNSAGGTEGGMTTGSPLVVRVAFKPHRHLDEPLHGRHGDQGEPKGADRALAT